MPLIQGSSRAAVSENIRREIGSGKKQSQAVAIALDIARRNARKKAGGGPVISDASPDLMQGGAQYAQASGPFVIRIGGGGLYSVVDIRTGQVRYSGSADGARQAQAQLMSGRASGGRIQSYAAGGGVDMSFAGRAGAKQLERSGLIRSPTAGRADAVPMGVKSNSYVIPAAAVSAIGQGNSMSGAAALDKMFKTTPGGAAMPHPHAMKPSIPTMRMPTSGMMKGRRGFDDGGSVDQMPDVGGEPVDVMTSGGEFVVSPDQVAQIGGGDVQAGHAILDGMVKHIMKELARTIPKLASPKKN